MNIAELYQLIDELTERIVRLEKKVKDLEKGQK